MASTFTLLIISVCLFVTLNTKFCLRHATLFRANSFVVGPNRTCHLFGNQGLFSSPCWPIFVRKHQKTFLQVLVRTRVERKTHPYHLLKTGPINSPTLDTGTLFNSSDPFKTPLISLHPVPFSQLRVQLFDGAVGSPRLRAELRFRLEEIDSISNGYWFSKDRLLASCLGVWELWELQSSCFSLSMVARDSGQGGSMWVWMKAIATQHLASYLLVERKISMRSIVLGKRWTKIILMGSTCGLKKMEVLVCGHPTRMKRANLGCWETIPEIELYNVIL